MNRRTMRDEPKRDETRKRCVLIKSVVSMVVYMKKPAVVERFRIGVGWKEEREEAVERGERCGGREEGAVRRRRRCPGTGRQPEDPSKGARERGGRSASPSRLIRQAAEGRAAAPKQQQQQQQQQRLGCQEALLSLSLSLSLCSLAGSGAFQCWRRPTRLTTVDPAAAHAGAQSPTHSCEAQKHERHSKNAHLFGCYARCSLEVQINAAAHCN